MHHCVHKLARLAATAVLTVIVLGSLSAGAMAYERKSSVTGAGGKTASTDVTATKTADGYQRSATATGPGGKTASSQSSGTWDPATKTWTKDKSVTGPNGQTKSWEKKKTVTTQ